MRNRAIQIYEYVMDLDVNDYEETYEQDLQHIEGLLKTHTVSETIAILEREV